MANSFPDREKIAQAAAHPVRTYEELVKLVAQLAHENPRAILLFRGQGMDFTNRSGTSTFYPSIYRAEYLRLPEVVGRFQRLEEYESELIDRFSSHSNTIDGAQDIRRRQLVRWSILQHYEVCPTPLLDFTHSLSVACSFAHHGANKADHAFVYAFAFPYLTNRISFNTEEDLVIVRLLSISPPAALRPYFQEGYLAGTMDITTEYSNKSELDFKHRLVAKFKVPTSAKFWSNGFGPVPEQLLMPSKDDFRSTMLGIKESSFDHIQPSALGKFLVRWIPVEKRLLKRAGQIDPKLMNVNSAIRMLLSEGVIGEELAFRLDSLRLYRNQLVHHAARTTPEEVGSRNADADEILSIFDRLGI